MTTNKKGQEIFILEGTVLRKYPSEQGKSSFGKVYTKNKFILKTLEGNDIYVTKFGQLSADLIGTDVRFNATKYNETNYTVDGEIESAGDLVVAHVEGQPSTQAVATPVTRRRGRPATSKAPVATSTASHPVTATKVAAVIDDAREHLRAQAENSTLLDLQSAVKLAKELGLDTKDTQGIVALADRVGRTITAIGMDNRNKR